MRYTRDITGYALRGMYIFPTKHIIYCIRKQQNIQKKYAMYRQPIPPCYTHSTHII